ncbi:MAG TPA: response regulator transcription factor [Hyphomicrobium sp.]|nr:response regulator transcription factor [Hyphomicrobium sp.]
MRCDHSIESLQLRRGGDEQSQRGASRDEETKNECLRILTIVRDRSTARKMLQVFEGKSFHQELTRNASYGLKLAATAAFDAIIVDSRISGADGAAWISALRDLELTTPCLLLLERDDIDRRSGRIGEKVDDFLVKPFGFSELNARLHRIARQPRALSEPAVLRFADLEMNLLTRRVTRGRRPIRLQPRQFQLLELLMQNRGRVVSRHAILDQVRHSRGE